MRSVKYLSYFVITLMLSHAAVAEDDELCPYLTNFFNSVKVDQVTSIELHTSWGSNFKGHDEDVIAAKRCLHGDISSAKKACEYLMDNTSTEFAGVNFKRFLLCLSPKTNIATDIQFSHAVVSLYFGNDERGARLNLSLEEDDDIGGMVLRLKAKGY